MTGCISRNLAGLSTPHLTLYCVCLAYMWGGQDENDSCVRKQFGTSCMYTDSHVEFS